MNINLIMNIFLPSPDLLRFFRDNKIKIKSLRERKCFECNCDLCFFDYISGCRKSNLAYRIKLWKNNYIEFYCCNCFKKKKAELSTNESKYICPGKIFCEKL